MLRFLTFILNDVFTYYDTVSTSGMAAKIYVRNK
jgi:hypothetical protein